MSFAVATKTSLQSQEGSNRTSRMVPRAIDERSVTPWRTPGSATSSMY
jgi:hypothetical protein